MAGVSKFPSTVFTIESTKVIMDQHMIIEAVLARECCFTNQALEWLDS